MSIEKITKLRRVIDYENQIDEIEIEIERQGRHQYRRTLRQSQELGPPTLCAQNFATRSHNCVALF